MTLVLLVECRPPYKVSTFDYTTPDFRAKHRWPNPHIKRFATDPNLKRRDPPPKPFKFKIQIRSGFARTQLHIRGDQQPEPEQEPDPEFDYFGRSRSRTRSCNYIKKRIRSWIRSLFVTVVIFCQSKKIPITID